MATEIALVQSKLGDAWAVRVTDNDDEAAEGLILAGPFLTRDEAVRADERFRVAELIGNRQRRMSKYKGSSEDERMLLRALEAGLGMAVEIAKLGACPACSGSGHDVPARGSICKVCGVDYTDYSMKGRRKSSVPKPATGP